MGKSNDYESLREAILEGDDEAAAAIGREVADAARASGVLYDMKIRSSMLCTGAMIVLAPGVLLAHHNFRSIFDTNLPVEVTGTVTEVRWTNPHARFFVSAQGEDGEVVTWDFELASPNSLFRRGWDRNSLKPGDTVTVTAIRARNVPHLANTSTVTLSDGQRVFGTLTSPRE